MEQVAESPEMIEFALAADRAGLCVVPPRQDGTKAPEPERWEGRESRRPERDHLIQDYRNGAHTGLGVVCGVVSGGLELFDFDDREKYSEFCERTESAGLGDLLERVEAGYKENSPNGVHLLYKCSTCSGNQKLARRPKTDDEKTHPNDKVKCLIETRGNGGYAILAPSHGSIHPSGKPYTLIRGGFESIVTITPGERAELHRIARTFDEMPPPLASSKPPKSKGNGELRPGDDYNDRAMWTEILEPHGWVSVFERNGETFWRRPGKSVGISATTNFGDSDLFYCFSTSTPFETERGIDKLGAYATLNHDGEIAAAARDLSARGFGLSPNVSVGHTKNEIKNWAECKPLPAPYDPVPNLSEKLIPEPLRAWIMDAAERTSVPLEFIAAPAVVSMGSVVGRSIGISPKCRDDWCVIPNLWGGIVGPTGVLKTAAVGEGTRQIRRLAVTSTEKFDKDKSDRDAKDAILEARISVVKARGKTAAGKNNIDLLRECEDELAGLLRQQEKCATTERRYITQDPTVEKLGEILKENPRGILLLRDELSGWLRTLDRQGHEGAREFYLESWNGSGSYTYDRIGRGTLHIEALTVSIFGGIQPARLRAYIDDALAHRGGDDGLLQRLQLLVWPDSVGDWRNVDRWPQSAARDRAFLVFERLDKLDPDQLSAKRIHPDAIPTLRFSGEAQELFNTWRAELEGRLRGDQADKMPSFTGHLSKYRSLMPSLALLFHLIESVDQGTRGGVSLHTAQQAAAWCEYLERHARKVYATEIRAGIPAAHRLAEQIRVGNILDGITVRDLSRRELSGLRQPDQILAGLEILEAAGWLQVLMQDTGGRPAREIRLNPGLKDVGHG